MKTAKNIRTGLTFTILFAALMTLAACAGGPQETRLAMLDIPPAAYEPITTVSFDAIDPYAPALQDVESAAGE